jgi:hypothetical protein
VSWLIRMLHRFHLRFASHGELVYRRAKLLTRKALLIQHGKSDAVVCQFDEYIDLLTAEFDRRRERLNARAKRVKLTGRGPDGVT